MVVKYINAQQKRDQAITNLVEQHFPELDKQNEIRARKRIPGATMPGKRKSRGRVGRTLQQQHHIEAGEKTDSDEAVVSESPRTLTMDQSGRRNKKTPSQSSGEHVGGHEGIRKTATRCASPTEAVRRENEEMLR